MSAGHTPTPPISIAAADDSTGNFDIYSTLDGDAYRASDALAERLTEIVNSHDALIAALRDSAAALKRAITMAQAGAAGKGAGGGYAPSDAELLGKLRYQLKAARAALRAVEAAQ